MKNNDIKKLQRKSMGAKASRRLSNTIIYIILVAMTIIWLFPFVGIVLESFKAETKMQTGYLFPKQFGFDHYVRLFKETDFLLWFKNTAIMGIATAFLQTFFVLTMSYTLSRLRFKGRKTLMNAMLILGMFPGFLTMILIYKVFAQIMNAFVQDIMLLLIKILLILYTAIIKPNPSSLRSCLNSFYRLEWDISMRIIMVKALSKWHCLLPLWLGVVVNCVALGRLLIKELCGELSCY